jgi:hypothetical protein
LFVSIIGGLGRLFIVGGFGKLFTLEEIKVYGFLASFF